MSRLATYTGLALAFMAVALVATLCGCVGDRMEQADGDPGSRCLLSMTIVTGDVEATRAGHADDYEEAGTASENFIDFAGNDFRIVLFDNAGGYICELDNLDSWTIFPSALNGTTSYYMEREIFFPETMSKEAVESIRANGLQVLVVANWRGADSSTSYGNLFVRGGGHSTLAEIWRDDASHNFSYTPAAGNVSWSPDCTAGTKRLIPMFGITKTSPFAYTGSGSRASATLSLQRAVAKVEVIDNLTSQPGIEIAGVTMTDFSTSGRSIPDVAANPGWNVTGSQVSTSSLPANVAKGSGLNFFPVVEDGRTKWVAYVPEMALAKTISESRTHLNVRVDGGDVYEGGTYPLHFASYDRKFNPTLPDESWNHILRNHIYRFSVNKVGLNVELELHVIPWQREEDEFWDYTENVSVSHSLEWQEDSCEKIDDSKDEVVLSFENDKWLTGKFGFMSPANARWYVRLTALDGANPYAMSFVDNKGDVMNPAVGDPKACLEISGYITPESQPVTLRIRPTSYANDYESRFRLEFFVENFGSWIEVPMANHGKYWTIVRPGNLIDF